MSISFAQAPRDQPPYIGIASNLRWLSGRIHTTAEQALGMDPHCRRSWGLLSSLFQGHGCGQEDSYNI